MVVKKSALKKEKAAVKSQESSINLEKTVENPLSDNVASEESIRSLIRARAPID